MTTRPYPQTTSQQVERGWRFSWVDLVVLLAIFALLWSLVALGGDMRVKFDELHPPPLSLDTHLIPYYTARTVPRMLIAFCAALAFTFVWGYIAAKSRRARKVMLPVLDILQSVPVLGFLSVTVTGFLALFPGSLLGVGRGARLSPQPLGAFLAGGAARIGHRPDLELDDELRRRMVLRGPERGHHGHEQEHLAFDAPDHKPVSEFLVLLVPHEANEVHLQLLATAASALSDTSVRADLRRCARCDEVRESIAKWEAPLSELQAPTP